MGHLLCDFICNVGRLQCAGQGSTEAVCAALVLEQLEQQILQALSSGFYLVHLVSDVPELSVDAVVANQGVYWHAGALAGRF